MQARSVAAALVMQCWQRRGSLVSFRSGTPGKLQHMRCQMLMLPAWAACAACFDHQTRRVLRCVLLQAWSHLGHSLHVPSNIDADASAVCRDAGDTNKDNATLLHCLEHPTVPGEPPVHACLTCAASSGTLVLLSQAGWALLPHLLQHCLHSCCGLPL